MIKPSNPSVIISTYNEPEWLEKAVWGYQAQDYQNFTLIIADDGSKHITADLIDRLKRETHMEILHVWHKDEGYQKCAILNKAVAAVKSDYVIFSDGDCIPRKDFVSVHMNHAEKGYFISGGTIRLPLALSRLIDKGDILSQRCFSKDWLLEHGHDINPIKNLKLTTSHDFAKMLNKFTPARKTWNGMNSSGWLKDIIEANGFNENLQYGGQDREFGLRLNNLGIKAKQLRFSAICLHLEHERSYKTEEAIMNNLKRRKEVIEKKITTVEKGLNQYLK